MIRKSINIAFFDIDHTIIDNDCDVSWKLFLIEKGLAPKSDKKIVKEYFELYKAGTLPIEDFLHFQLKEFVGKNVTYINKLALEHFSNFVKPKIYSDAYDLLMRYKENKTKIVSISGCNNIILQPINDYFAFNHSITTKLETENRKFTGDIIGKYVLKDVKWDWANKYTLLNNSKLNNSAFYADSINDVPLLNMVKYPFVINPDKKMQSLAVKNNWECLRWIKYYGY